MFCLVSYCLFFFFLINSNINFFLEKILKTDCQEFCFLHFAETEIIPLCIQSVYPTNIDFTILLDRINDIKNDLLDIINCKLKSWFHDLALFTYNKLKAQKARTPIILIERSEELRV